MRRFALRTIHIISVYNLTESIDVDETNRRVEEYKKQNADLIVAQRTKQLEQMRNQQSSIEMEKKSIESSLLDMQVSGQFIIYCMILTPFFNASRYM